MIILPNKVLFALWPGDNFHLRNPEFLKVFNGPLKMCSIRTKKDEHNDELVEHMVRGLNAKAPEKLRPPYSLGLGMKAIIYNITLENTMSLKVNAPILYMKHPELQSDVPDGAGVDAKTKGRKACKMYVPYPGVCKAKDWLKDGWEEGFYSKNPIEMVLPSRVFAMMGCPIVEVVTDGLDYGGCDSLPLGFQERMKSQYGPTVYFYVREEEMSLFFSMLPKKHGRDASKGVNAEGAEGYITDIVDGETWYYLS
jgi:hypothetical protein